MHLGAASKQGRPMLPYCTAAARPRPFTFPLPKTALLILKMQHEFLSEGGYGSLLGNDINGALEIVPQVQALLESARAAGVEVIHTKEGHKSDLSDVPASKMRRTKERLGGKLTIGDEGPLGRILVDCERGNDFVPECKPVEGEMVFTTGAKGVLYNTGLHQYCIDKGFVYIILAGLTTEIGVQLVMRELNDRGFESCVVNECTSSYFQDYKASSMDMIIAQGGIIGWTAALADITAALVSPELREEPAVPSWIPSTVPVLLNADPPPPAVMPVEGPVDGPWATIAEAKPYSFSFPVAKTAVIVIDMQRDFILEGGFGSTLGNNVKLLQAIVPTVAFLLKTCREHKVQLVHTLEAHLPDLSDCPLAKLTRGGLPEGLRIGDKGDMGRILIRNEWGNDIVDENAPIEGEKVIFKPGKGAFFGTDLHQFLFEKGITHLLFAGVTTEVCVQTSMREANDRGFECLMISDCTESYFPHFKSSTIDMIAAQGAIVGWSATAQQLKAALDAAAVLTSGTPV